MRACQWENLEFAFARISLPPKKAFKERTTFFLMSFYSETTVHEMKN